MFGVKTGNMMDNGNIIRCMGLEKFNGLMVVNTKVNMKMIRNMAMVHFFGQMEGSTLEAGEMENSMERVNIIYKMEIKR